MDFRDIGLLIGLTVFLVYVAYVWGRFGVQESISISFYDFPNHDRWVFRCFIWILSTAIIISGIGWHIPYFFIGGALLTLVGFFSSILIKRRYIVHMIGAIGGIISCYIGVLVADLTTGIIAGIGIIIQSLLCYIFAKKEHFIWNLEIACFTFLMGSLLYLNY